MSSSAQLVRTLGQGVLGQAGVAGILSKGCRPLSLRPYCSKWPMVSSCSVSTGTPRWRSSSHLFPPKTGIFSFSPVIAAQESWLPPASLYSTSQAGPPQTDSSKKEDSKVEKQEEKEVKVTLWQKFKIMYKQYWYVLVPVHCITSAVWFGAFYYAARSGLDLVPLLESVGAPEAMVKSMRETGAGYIAVAYGLYKISTPARYTVTLGGTTIAINYLKEWGYIKPMPSSEQMKEMIREKSRQLRSSRAKVLAKMNLRRKPSRPKSPEDREKT